MRLTLRTLLSYLDDTLEPAQAKAIGAKVAESEQARELMERIKQVTRRRRLTTPPTTGPGGMDSNTIAEYLDNEVKEEKATEVEQICLASDVHLAEVAACHQILTLVLGEPALVPPSAKQRMYKLVHGPESIQSRKPAKAAADVDQDLSSEIDFENDETLRLGVPAVGGGKGLPRTVWIYAGGGVLAASLFVFAIWRLIHSIPSDRVEPKGDQIVQIEKDAGKKDEPPKIIDDKDKTPPAKVKKEEKPPATKKEDKTGEIQPIKVESVDVKPPPEIPYREASSKQAPIAHYIAPPFKAPAVLLQADKLGWARIGGKNAAVSSGRMLLSLPGSKSVVTLDTGVELTLWGNLFELTLDPILGESRATLHANDTLDADLTLDRGRIILRNDKKDGKDATARVRFFNPTLSEENYFDIILTTGSAVAVERGAEMDRDEPFFEDPKNALRQGPIATMRIYQFAGTSTVLWAKLQYGLDETQQPALQWNSRELLPSTPKKLVLPPWLKGVPALKKDDPLARDRAIVIRAHDDIAKRLEKDKQIDVVLAEVVQDLQDATQKELTAKKGLSPEVYLPWRNVFRCYAAIDDVRSLFETFSQDNTPMFVRGFCMMTLQQWLPQGRDNDFVLLDAVRKSNIKKTPSIKIMELFHLVSAESAAKPATYQNLIEGLNNDLLPIRTLSHWHLMNLAPAGRGIPYDPAMPRQQREVAVRQWLMLIPPGQLPPRDAPTKKDKG